MRRFPSTDGGVRSKVRVAGLLEVVPRMNLMSSELVMKEGRMRGCILICAVTKRMLARRFSQSASLVWVMNLSTLMLVNLWMSLGVAIQPPVLLGT